MGFSVKIKKCIHFAVQYNNTTFIQTEFNYILDVVLLQLITIVDFNKTRIFLKIFRSM